eukprot:scaffold187699_cov49-Attheya_sp.AAC.2
MSHITPAPPSSTRSPSGGFTWGFAGHAQQIQPATMYAADVARCGVEGLRDEINKTHEKNGVRPNSVHRQKELIFEKPEVGFYMMGSQY